MLLIVPLLVLVALLFLVVGIYNGLVRSRNDVKNAWSQIDVQLKRRHDLIPNLVERPCAATCPTSETRSRRCPN